ncbi:MAG: PKD domain-containing protein, partial [Candidatus Zixiibacteriota bacterium]
NYSTLEHPTHTYKFPGTYSITLTVTGPGGTASITKDHYVIIKTSPTADFTSDITEGCVELTVKFKDLSIDADEWLWDFGDGQISHVQNPVHTYTAVGTYTVSLVATNECGPDVKTRVDYITVYGGPTADFTSDVTEGCAPLKVSFIDLSKDADSWSWEFGDGASSIDQNPSHTYANPGVYTVTLTVSNKCGDDTEEKIEYITVYGGPTAAFIGSPRTGAAPLTVDFTDRSKSEVGLDTWFWDFGDPASGSDNFSSLQDPTHVYTDPGYYTVYLKVTDACGEDDTTRVEYIYVPETCEVDFTGKPRSGCAPLKVDFEGTATDACDISSWTWNFGDPASGSDNTGFGQNVTHTYENAGIYTVMLVAADVSGTKVVIKTDYITVFEGPTAEFTADFTEGCAELTVTFTDQSTGAESWSWNFGDPASGSENVSTLQNPTHKFSDPGKYTITLTVTNDNPEECNSDTEKKEEYITVFGGPTADFSGTPRSGEAPLTVDFKDLSTSEVGIDSWSWDFGDPASGSANVSDLQNPTHTYNDPGWYTVKLTVVDACGDDDEIKLEYIHVIDTCKVDFSGTPRDGCAPLDVDFEGTTRGPCEIVSWTWDFGDPASGSNNIGSGQNVSHTYNDPGTYTVTLTAEDVSGTKIVTKEDYITAYGGPTAAFSASLTSGTAPLYVDFTDQSTSEVGIDTWSWDFGDPASGSDNVSDETDPSHVYEAEGVYTVTLIVTDACGADTTTEDITVIPMLSITKEVDELTAFPNDTLEYTLTIVNNSEDVATNIIVVDSIPDSSGFITGSITGGGTYDPMQDQVTWSIASIKSGEQIEVSFKVVLDGPFIIFPTAVSNYATGTVWGPRVKNDYPLVFVSNIVTTVVYNKPTDLLEISKDVDVTLATPGDLLTYTITIFNNSPEAAENVTVADTIPDSTTFTGWVTGGGVYDQASNSLTWDLGTMNPFDQQVLYFQVTIDTDVRDGQQIINSAAILTPQYSPSNQVITDVSLVPLVITKTANRPSAMIGEFVQFTISIKNYSNETYTDVQLIDTMPGGIFYVDGTSLLNGSTVADPTGDIPYRWLLGSLQASETFTVEFTALVGASARPGINENIAWAVGYHDEIPDTSNRAVARIYVLAHTLTGSIRGKVIVDCDGDGIPDIDTVPSGMDVYLDDGSQSRVNEEGMFYFSTVRPGERVVALDERDLEGFYIPEDAEASVFVHVHETGESYIIFRICPEYPRLDIQKKASIVPTVKVTKAAKLDPDQPADSLGVKIDYEIDIKSNGLADPTQVRVVDSFPANTRLILAEQQPLVPEQRGNQLVYEVTAAQERLQKSVYYSLRDLTPGIRRFLTNKVYLEGDLAKAGEAARPVLSDPVEVAAGPFLLAPPRDVKITLTPALFVSGKAYLQPPAIPQLEATADSIDKYSDAEIRVEGHCDYRPIHTEEFPSNWELGEGRARAVVDWLVENRAIDRARLAYESFAATRPVDPGRTPEAWQKNRRTEVIIQARVGVSVEPSALPAEKWESSTALALNPTKFDTLFETAQTPLEIDLDDSWEVLLTIENTSAIAAEDVGLTDILPDDAAYIDNSATVDGKSITATVSGSTLSMKLDRIEAMQKLVLRYRIRALQGRTPTGGGAASVELKTATDLTVVQKSNEVRFK